MLPEPWLDPKEKPPEEYSEVIIWLETGRVTAGKYYKGKFNTYTPVLGWQPFPEPPKQRSGKPAIKRKS